MKRILLCAVAVLILSSSQSSANSNLYFPPFELLTGFFEGGVAAIGDVNNDGRNDFVITVSSGPGTQCFLYVYLQNAMGSLEAPVSYLIPNPPPGAGIEDFEGLAIGDVNNDGRNDVVVGNSGASLRIEVYFQNAEDKLDASIAFPNLDAKDIKICDVNGDGLLDIVGVGAGLSLLIQNKDGGFNEPLKYPLNPKQFGYIEVDVGDVNHDGLMDIIVLNYNSHDIGVLLQSPGGVFGPQIDYHSGTERELKGLAVGDVNGDGLADIVFTSWGNRPDSKLGVFLQDNAGNIMPPILYDALDLPASVELADVNNDGRLDIVVYHDVWMNFGAYLQDTAGNLLPEELYFTSYLNAENPHSMAVGDINGDNLQDVIVVESGGRLILVYHRTNVGFPDVTASSQVDFGIGYIGNKVQKDAVVANIGFVNLSISQVALSGINSTEFNIRADNCSGMSLEFTTTCSVQVEFSPSSPGSKTAFLNIFSNDPDTPALNIPLFSCATYAHPKLFYPVTYKEVDSVPTAVAIGDVNNDGRNDVVTSYYFAPENVYYIHVLLQNALGELDPPVQYPRKATYGVPESIDIGDVNNDGLKDIVVGNARDNIEVFLQNASGTLDPSIPYPTKNSTGLKIGDLNNDGLLDIVGVDTVGVSEGVAIFFQNTNGTLDEAQYYYVDVPALSGGTPVLINDVNNDKLNDIIVMGTVLLQKPIGDFSDSISFPLTSNVRGIASGDVNGDNLEDIVSTFREAFAPLNKISIFLQNSSGTLQPELSYPSSSAPGAVQIADVNKDGKKDIIVVHDGYLNLGVYLQDAYCQLLPEEHYSLPFASYYNRNGVAIGDINSDGFNDVVIADYNMGLDILYNRAQAADIPDPSFLNISILKKGTGGGTVTSNPARINCGSDCTETFAIVGKPTKLRLTAIPDTGSTFKGWSGACIGTKTKCTLVMDASKAATAEFAWPDLTGTFANTVVSLKSTDYQVSTVLTVTSGEAKAAYVAINVYLSDNGILDIGDTLLTPTLLSLGTMTVGKMKPKKLKFVSETNPSGKYLIAVLDPDNTVMETDESNNFAIGAIP